MGLDFCTKAGWNVGAFKYECNSTTNVIKMKTFSNNRLKYFVIISVEHITLNLYGSRAIVLQMNILYLVQTIVDQYINEIL